jgi:hypothetical protein
MLKKKGKRWLGLLLAVSMLIPGNVTSIVSAEGIAPAADAGASLTEPAGRRNFAIPSDSKHAYDPFAQLENEEATEAYRESAEAAEGTIVYKQTEKTGLFRPEPRPETEESELESLGIAVDTAQELNRRKVDSGLFSSTYEVTYQAALDGDVWETVDALAEVDGIVDAQPDYVYHTTAIGVPDATTDPDFDRQWYLSELHMQDIWQDYAEMGLTPGMETVVAVIDTGVDYTHPDLIPSMWVNTAELNGLPGVDDDGNGYVDDVYGVSTVGGTNDHTGDPMDDHGHGTHVAGIIAMAAGNRQGGAGAAYGAKIMAIKAGQATGSFSDTDIAEAIRYAAANGADVINMSFGGYGHSFLVEEALQDAFGSCVLVASAGNDGIPTSDAPPEFLQKADTYPAGYSYVLGVMASDQDGNLASFSNWDYYGDLNAEYELTAPGVDIFSTLPGGQYALWSGTSMAAPVVSAAAAVLRTQYFDKDLYSSRFIMGQLASATEDAVTYVDAIEESHTYAALNIQDSLHNLPKPSLSLKSSYLFDGEDIAAGNDNDGIVDAGETIDLGLVLRNQWGLAGDVTVTADAKSEGGIENPNVEFITDTITMADVGTFSEQDNGFRYDGDYLEGTDNPIRFKIKDDTINDAHIPINVHVSARNGFDEEDYTVYGFDFTIDFYVQRGRVLKGRVTEDMTLTKEDYWIIENSLYIPEGVTVNVEPGTQIQFWSSEPEGPYDEKAIAYIQVDGEFYVNGTEEEPVEMFPSTAFQDYGVDIRGGLMDNLAANLKSAAQGTTVLRYASILNPILNINEGDHLTLVQDPDGIRTRRLSSSTVIESSAGTLTVQRLTNSVVRALRAGEDGHFSFYGNAERVLFDGCSMRGAGETSLLWARSTFTQCAFVGNQAEAGTGLGAASIVSNPGEPFRGVSHEFSEVYTIGDRKYILIDFGNENNFPLFYLPYRQSINDTNTGDRTYPQIWKLLDNLAKNRGGTLACFGSEEEWQAVQDAVLPAFSGMGRITFGLTADPQTGELSWVDGSAGYFPEGTQASGSAGSYAPYGVLNVYSSGSISISKGTTNSVQTLLLLEYPDTVADEVITAPYTTDEYRAALPEWQEKAFTGNAVLSRLLNPDTAAWMTVQTTTSTDSSAAQNTDSFSAINNYWGTEDERLIQSQITDFDDYVELPDLIHTPWLTLDSPELEDIYPFVTKAYVTDTEGNPLESVGFQTVQLHVEFNRDMDPDVQPMVSYGPAEPYTDHVVSGDWIDARHWVGETSVKPLIDSGTQYIRVKGGAAADDNWLTTGTDWGRFAFTIHNTGVQAMNLQAEGREGEVRLSWSQTDYDTLAGYNLYRAESADGPFTKLNPTLIPGTIREYTDKDVEAGKDYYYYFTVVGTDMSESDPSNTAAGTPLDNIKPVLEHTRVTRGKYGEALSFSAAATDNVGVEYVKVFYRAQGEESWSTLNLSAGENGRYFGVIPAGEVSREGMEYYIEASDGTSVARDGSAQQPIRIAIDSTAVIYSVSPSYVDTAEAAGGVTAILTGVNFTEDMDLSVGGKPVEYTFDSDKQLTFEIPAGSIGRVDIQLKRDGETAAILTNAITYEDAKSEVQIVGGSVRARESVRLPVTVTADGDLFGISLKLTINPALFSGIAFEKAEEAAGAYADYNTDAAGHITVVMSSATAIPTDAPIGYLVLTAKDLSDTTSTPIQLTEATLNDVDAASRVDGSVTVEPNFTVGGRITYYKDGSPMKGVTVKLSNGMSAVTDEDGRYTITGVTTGNVRVTPELHGMANDAVTAYDAALVLQALVGKAALTEDQQRAANVNGDTELTAMDAAYILQKSVGIVDGDYPGSGAEWVFTPSDQTVSLTGDNTSLDFTGYLLGDVNGDWSAAG